MSTTDFHDDDEYVAKLLAEDARKTSMKYASNGLSALLSKRPPGSAPKPNTRFLRNLVREADSHNAALKKKEELEARNRLKEIRRRDREKRDEELRGGNSRKRRRASEDEDGNHEHHHKREKKKRKSSSSGHHTFKDTRTSESGKSRDHEGESKLDQKERHKPEHQKRHSSRESKRESSSSDKYQIKQGEGTSKKLSEDIRRKSRSENEEPNTLHKTKSRSEKSSEKARQQSGSGHEKTSTPHKKSRYERSSEHVERHSRREHRKSSTAHRKLASDTKTPVDLDVRKKTASKRHTKQRSPSPSSTSSSSSSSSSDSTSSDSDSESDSDSDSSSDSDPLEELVGPLPSNRSKSRKHEVANMEPRIRGRGADKLRKAAGKSTSNIDAHFSSTYDPNHDAYFDSDGDYSQTKESLDWDTALHAFRDQKKRQSKQADRLREAGWNEDKIGHLLKSSSTLGVSGQERTNKEEDISHVKWVKQGEQREWDLGKEKDDWD